LAVKVGEFDRVGVDDADGADAGGREVGDGGAAESAATDDEHARGGEAALVLGGVPGQGELPAIACEALGLEWGAGLDDGFRHPEPPSRSSLWCASARGLPVQDARDA